jgi:hypothetical protein
MQTRAPIHLEDNLSMFILQHYSSSNLDEQGEGRIECCTEYHKTDATTKEKMICIFCHPNFRAKGYPWYDWALIQFELSTGVKMDFPCCVLACVPSNAKMKQLSTTLSKAVTNQPVASHSSSPSGCSERNSML